MGWGNSRLILAFVMLASVCLAQAPADSNYTNYTGFNNPVLDRVYARLGNATLEGNAGSEILMHELTLVVLGSNMDGPEKAFWESAKAANPILNNATIIQDGGEALKKVRSGDYLVVLVLGGPSQNAVAGPLEDAGIFNESQEMYGVLVKDGVDANGSMIVMVSDKRGVDNAPRENVKYSPLTAAGVPPEYVPVAATGISTILMGIAAVGRAAFENKFSDLGKKGKKFGEGAVMVFGVNVMELGAIAFVAVILGLAMSWQYFGMTQDFFLWLFLNGTIVLLSVIVHEVTHRLFATLFKIKLEYRIWPEGSLLTLVSSYLGNTFSAQSFLLDEIPEDTPKWKVGIMRLAAPLVSNGIALAFAGLNVFAPNTIFQAIYTASSVFAMAEMLPIEGLDGNDVKKWNFWIWLFFFLFVAACYIFVTFIL